MTDVAKCAGLQVNGDPCPQRRLCWHYLVEVDANTSRTEWLDVVWHPDRGYCQDFTQIPPQPPTKP